MSGIKLTIEDPNLLEPHEVVALNSFFAQFPNLAPFYLPPPNMPGAQGGIPMTDGPKWGDEGQTFGQSEPTGPTEPAAPTEPTEPAAPTEPTEESATLDIRGFPWDSRIHSRGKAQNKDGTWRYKKGLDDTVKTAVEAELAANFTKNQEQLPMSDGETLFPPAEEPVAPPPPADPVVPDPVQEAAAVPAPPVDPTPTEDLTFPSFMAWCTQNSLSMDEVMTAVSAVGLQVIPQLAQRSDLIPKVKAKLEASLQG